MDIISIYHNPVGSQLMTYTEKRIIIETFHKFKDDRINFLRLVETLKVRLILVLISVQVKAELETRCPD